MKLRLRRSTALAAACLLAVPLLTQVPAHAAETVDITLVDINDFHGRIDSNTTAFATTIEKIRAAEGEANTLFVSVGDNIGASPYASAVQQDKPTIEVLNALDLAVSAVGNHEFDRGYADLVGRVKDAADFTYLGANVHVDGTGHEELPASATFDVAGVKVAVIGAVTEETPTLVTPAGIAGVDFTDPVEAVNDEVERLATLPEADRPDVYVATFHDGAGAGTPDGSTLEQEIAAGGVFAQIVNKTDPRVSAILTGHTHKEYDWEADIPGTNRTRPILQTGSYGEHIGKITLSVDPDTGAVVNHESENVERVKEVDETLPRVAEVKEIVDEALAYAKEEGSKEAGTITADITTAFAGERRDDRASESTLGNLVADGMLEQSKNTQFEADLSVTNPGGLRWELFYKSEDKKDTSIPTGVVSVAEINEVLPFTNNLYTVKLTGASLKKVFEQQWQRTAAGEVPSRPYLQLGVSKNVRYTFDSDRPEGERITGLWVNDEQVDPTKEYRVIVPSFLASGGDNFHAFTEGTWNDTGVVDYEGFIEYFKANSPVSPDFARRAVQVKGLNDTYRPGDEVSFTLPKLDLTSLGSPKNTSVAGTVKFAGGSNLDIADVAVHDGASENVTFTIPENTPAGAASINVTAMPSGTTATLPLTIVQEPSRASAKAPREVSWNENFEVSVTVDSESGYLVSGTVDVLRGDKIVGSGKVSEGSASATVSASDLSVGRNDLKVRYNGSGRYEASETSLRVNVVKAETGLTLTGSKTAYGKGAFFDVVAQSGATGIVFVANAAGRNVGIGFVRDGRGRVVLGGTALRPATHTLYVFFNGSAGFEPADGTVKVTVTKGKTAVSAKAKTKKIRAKKTRAVLTVRVKGAGFTPASGTVVVTHGKKTIGKAAVRKGKANIKLKKFAKRGNQKIRVEYRGDATSLKSARTIRVKVVK